jgi:hypothetical protein
MEPDMSRVLLLAAVVGIGLAGCSKSDTPAAGGNAPAAVGGVPAAPKVPVAVPVEATPDQVVSVFLSALRTGDEATTANLLTAKAREETARHGIEVAPQSAPNARYDVHPAEILAENPHGAHVTSVWTETYDDGTVTYQIVWVLRREQPGWRIAGMALELIPDQPPAFLNFEDPVDMLRKRDEAVAALQGPAAVTAQVPDGNAGAAFSTEPPAANGFPPAAGTFAPSTQPIDAAPPTSFSPAQGGVAPANQPPPSAPPTFAPPAGFDR